MGLKNLKVIYKINIISLITIILLGIVTFYTMVCLKSTIVWK